MAFFIKSTFSFRVKDQGRTKEHRMNSQIREVRFIKIDSFPKIVDWCPKKVNSYSEIVDLFISQQNPSLFPI